MHAWWCNKTSLSANYFSQNLSLCSALSILFFIFYSFFVCLCVPFFIFRIMLFSFSLCVTSLTVSFDILIFSETTAPIGTTFGRNVHRMVPYKVMKSTKEKEWQIWCFHIYMGINNYLYFQGIHNFYFPSNLEGMSEWLLFNTNSAIFQLHIYHGENKFIFNEMMMMSALY